MCERRVEQRRDSRAGGGRGARAVQPRRGPAPAPAPLAGRCGRCERRGGRGAPQLRGAGPGAAGRGRGAVHAHLHADRLHAQREDARRRPHLGTPPAPLSPLPL